MKKFLIGVVLLIPIIVVMAITATGSIMVAIDDHIYPKSMEFKDADTNEAIEFDDVIELWMGDDSFHFLIDIYPTIAFDRTATYKIDEIEGYNGDAELVHVESKLEGVTNEYAIIPKKTGTVRMLIMANGDNNITKPITVSVKSDVMESMRVVVEDGSVVGEKLNLTTAQRLYCDVSPLESLASITWYSDNSDYVRVSDSGYIQPMGAGRTYITAVATSKAGGELTQQILVDTTATLVKNTEVRTALASVDESWLRSYVLIDKSADIEDLGGGRYKVSKGEAFADVSVITGFEKAWGFMYDMPNTIYTNRRALSLDCTIFDYVNYIDNSAKSVTYSIIDGMDVAELSGNLLTAKKAGSVTVLATASDGSSDTITLAVKECPLAFELTLNKEDYEVGLSRQRIWGIYFYNERGEEVNTYQFGSTLDETKTEVLWSISDPAVTIDANHMLTFAPEAAGKNITVTASVMAAGKKTGVQRSFTFCFCEDPNSINIETEEEFQKVNLTGRDIVIQPSIDTATGEARVIHTYKEEYLTSSLYANGVTLDVSNVPITSGNTTAFNYYPKRTPNAEKFDFTREVHFRDAVIFGAEDFESSNGKATAVYIKGNKGVVNVEYCRIYYMNTGIRTWHRVNEETPITADINIKGCLISDCYFCGMMFSSDPPISDNLITVEDCVFSHFTGACIFVANCSMDEHIFYENIYPNLKFAGRVEFYNWMTTEGLGQILNGLAEGSLDNLANSIGSTSEKLMSAVSNVVKELFTREDMQYLIYNNPEDGEQYMSLGLMALGAYCYSDAAPHTVIEDSALELLQVDVPTKGNGLGDIGTIIGLIDAAAKLVNPKMTIANDLYLICYNFSTQEPRVKPGDPLPMNEELYAILGGRA